MYLFGYFLCLVIQILVNWFHVQYVLTDVSFCNGSHTSELFVKTCLVNLLYPWMTNFLFCLQWWPVCNCLKFPWVLAHTVLWNYLTNERNADTPKRHLSLLSFTSTWLHTHTTFSNVWLRFLPNSAKPAIKMSSQIPNAFDMPLTDSYIFFWNISPTGATPNSNFLHK